MPFSDPHHPLSQADNLRRAINAGGVALWSWKVADDRFAMDQQAFKLWGLAPSLEVKFEDLSAHIHPADRDRVREAFTATRGILGTYEIDFRIMVQDEIRWISARGLGDNSARHDGQNLSSLSFDKEFARGRAYKSCLDRRYVQFGPLRKIKF